MRIGIVCPYSLSLPGGVQNQVLSLARSLRRRGHEVRVLAPCDGPPPELFVIPVGKSLPTAANGSVAPIAPDPSAQLRTIRALWDEGFDVIHAHEPLAPGPCHTALVVKPAPIVGTFHAAGSMPAYSVASGLANWGANRIDVRRQFEPLTLIPAMAEVAGEMVHDVLTAYAARDPQLATEVVERDNKVDAFYNSIFRNLLTHMMENPSSISSATQLLFVARNLERIGDHATNVAEQVYYAATGAYLAEREDPGNA